MDLGHPAALARGQGVAGGGAAGVPVYTVQPDTAGGLGGDRGERDGLPAKGAVAVRCRGRLAQPGAQGLEGQQAEGADRHEHHRLHPEGAGDQTAQQGCGAAHSEPDGDEIQGHGLENDEADGGQKPENGVNRHEFSLLFPHYRAKRLKSTETDYE